MTKKTNIILLVIIILGFSLRLIGLNWDQSQHLHPDERFLTMVSSQISLPKNISEYFNTTNSRFNPSNNGFDFYVYGTFPLLTTKIIASIFKLNPYNQIFLVGRFLSALFDTLTILLVFLITQKLLKNNKPALFSAFIYSICIFPIQQSHFFTVDATTVFLFTFSLYLLLSKKISLSGLIFGIALASKTSVGIILPFIFLYIFLQNKSYLKNLKKCFLFGVFLLLAFRIFQPYAFDGFTKLSPKFISNIKEAHQMITGEIDYPPNIQWKSTTRFVHPLKNIFFVGVGPITFIFVIWGIYKIISTKKYYKNLNYLLILSIILTIFIYHSLLLAKYMRYFYPIYPLLIICSGIFINKINPKKLKVLIIINIIFTLGFLNIYLFPHSRYVASEWICKNIPSTSNISSESWDDSLPLNIPSCPSRYVHQELNLFDAESKEKWNNINQKLDKIDYLILSSNRLWGSIPKFKQRYPATTNFYKNLFDHKINFKLIKKIYSYPGFHLPFIKKCILIGYSNYPYKENNNKFIEVDQKCNYPGIYFRDDNSEESFTVYDHPQVLIFQKITK